MLKVMGYKLKDKFISYEIKTMSNMYCCKHCNRAYKRKVYFDRHVIACEIMSKPKKQRDVEAQELSDTPTVRQLYDVILEMGKKMVDMEKQIEELNTLSAISIERFPNLAFSFQKKKLNE